jgi:hypothetical protein
MAVPVTRLLATATLVAVCVIIPPHTSATSQTIESAYTDLDLDKCRHAPSREAEDYGFWRCQGFAGIPVRVSAGDQRTYVSYGKDAEVEPAARQTFPSFNSIDKTKIEWRLEKQAGQRKPFATIARWHVKIDQDNKPSRGRVLVVTRLGDLVCHVGYVDALANKEANSLARDLADKHARAFNCHDDVPIILGELGESIADTYHNIRIEKELKALKKR